MKHFLENRNIRNISMLSPYTSRDETVP